MIDDNNRDYEHSRHPDRRDNLIESVKNIIYITLSVLAIGQGYLTIHDKMTDHEYRIGTLEENEEEIKKELNKHEYDIKDLQFKNERNRNPTNNPRFSNGS